MLNKSTLFALLSSLALAGPAFAQAQRPAQPAPATGGVSQPDNTTATYGDWVMRCQQGVGTRVCEIVQTVEQQGQRGPIALVAVGRPVKGEPYKLVVQVPPNLTLGNNAGVRVSAGEKEDVLAVFQRCTPGGCFGEANLNDDAFKRWRGLSEAGQLRYQDSAKRDVTLPLSFRGFTAATDALLREQP
ncbi:invasion associated locus B family protein [Bosea sp. (in: a-proteobacteria)]|uniref:invasion associated locus B family protein n=1 Tax=Bosea sp. (in: a-proteobacteria) TaxID=1871050 RepID=UPI002FC6044E